MSFLSDPPTRDEIGNANWMRWFSKVRDVVFKERRVYEVAINPASVSANSTSEQTFTVTGLTTDDLVYVNKPSHASGLIIGNCRASANNTLAITFANITGSPIDAGSEIYLVYAFRK